MAKKKLNVKFLALVLGALGVGVAVLGLIVLVQFRNDPVRHVKRGDTLVAEAEASKDGDERNSLYDAARQQYVRAIGKKPGEMAYYDLAIDATTHIEPTSSNEARDLYFFLASLLAGKIEYTRDADIRAETTAQLLDNLDVMTFSVPRDRSGSGLRAHQYVADRLESAPFAEAGQAWETAARAWSSLATACVGESSSLRELEDTVREITHLERAACAALELAARTTPAGHRAEG